ncbi:hypothetical protein RN001_015494 [Aquatica leii]|uniref:Luciferin 4-monooxygenase n=1 Tax=Aquatica leii TaxID=1421715 RepID=A0AAN7SNI8_9COLE|nr:hypothetical protein RN001_015494 [Aquatica leii]
MNKIRSNNVISIPAANYDFDRRGIGRMYYDSMLKNQDKIALIDGVNGNTVTYKELLQNAVRLAIALRKDNIKPQDIIAIYCYNHMSTSSVLIAGFFINAIVVGIDEKAPLERVVTILKQIKPKAIFAAESVLETLSEATRQLCLITKIVLMDCSKPNYVFLEDYIQPFLTEEETFEPVSAESLYDNAMIFFTSGTTGTPKGVCRSHLSLLYPQYNIMSCGFCWDVILEFSTPAWSVHLNYLSISIFQGTARVIYQKYTPEYGWQFPLHKVTCMFLGIWEVFHMYHYNQSRRSESNYLKTVIVGGTTLSPNKLQKIRKVFPQAQICNNYGQTETGAVFFPKPSHSKENLESLGKGLPGVSYKVADLISGRALGPNQKGELRIKTVYPLGCYYNADLSVMYDEDGWYKSGDLTYYDDDGCFYIVGRIKETFKFRCYAILPSAIEDVLLKHPAVDMAFVTGIPHDLDGQHPIGVVTLKKGFNNITPNDIKKYVAKQVVDHQRLRAGVKIIDKFVMTTSGKIDRKFAQNYVSNTIM